MFLGSRFVAVALVAVACAPFATAQERTPAQSREELATRLKRTVDRRLAEAVRRVREELHRDIDAALRQDKTDPTEIERLLAAMDDPAAGGTAPPAPPVADRAETPTPVRPIRRRPAVVPEVAQGDTDQMIADLDRQLLELEHRGAPAADLDRMRKQVVELKEEIFRRRDGASGSTLKPFDDAVAAPPADPKSAGGRSRFLGEAPPQVLAPVPARGWLGATFGPVGAEFRAKHDIPAETGLRVIQTSGADSPAAAGGLQPNDVLLAFAGAPVTTVTALAAAIGARAAGDGVELSGLRGGAPFAIHVTLGAVPTSAPAVETSARDMMKAAEAAALKEVVGGEAAVPAPKPEPASRPASRRARRAASRPSGGGD